jgi:tripartite-type tricarboxylate transporter receptor subunit TctC
MKIKNRPSKFPDRKSPLSRRDVVKVAAAAGLAAAIPFPLGAQGAWPKARAIRIIIPFPPGNTMDVMSRLIAPRLSERLGTPVVVENRDGAGGRIGMSAIARSAPDGYTFGGGQGGTMVVQPHTSKNLPYDVLKDFEPIALSTKNFLVIGGANNSPFTTIREMVAWARANPGKLTVGTNGEGGFPHLAFEDFCRQGKFSYIHVPYKGSAGIATDLSSGQIMACIDGVTGLTPIFQAGSARLLAVTNDVKVKQWPNTPTANEAVPGFTSNGWFGYIAPAGVPAEIIVRLNQEINAAMGLPAAVERLDGVGLAVISESAQYFKEVLLKDYKRYGDLVRSIGFVPQ